MNTNINIRITGRIAAILLCAIVGICRPVYAKQHVVLSKYKSPSGNYAFRTWEEGELLSPQIFKIVDKVLPQRGLFVVQRASDSKWNAYNDNLMEILPEWSDKKPVLFPPFVLVHDKDGDVLYDFNGKLLFKSLAIKPLMQPTNGNTRKIFKDVTTCDLGEYGDIVIGFSVIMPYNGQNVYTFLPADIKFPEHSYLSVVPVEYASGLLQFYTGKETIVTDLEQNLLDKFEGRAELEYTSYENTKRPLNEVYAYWPVFSMTYNTDYKGVTTGRALGKIVFPESKFELLRTLSRKKKKDITKFFTDPAIKAEYTEKVTRPLSARVDSMISMEKAMRSSRVEVKAVSGPKGYFFSTDGVKPIAEGEYYESIIVLGDSAGYIGRHGQYADLIGANGRRCNGENEYTDVVPLDKNDKYFLATCAKFPKVKILNIDGENIGTDLYDDVVYTQGAIGDVLYILRDKKWRAWAPAYRKENPIMPFYDYVGPADANGVVQVKYKGFPGSYNLKTGKETSPVEVLFNQAYNGSNLTDAQRIKIYKQVLALDEELSKGWSGAALNNLGVIYQNAGDEDTAFQYFERSKNMGNDSGKSNYNSIRNSRRLDRISKVAGAISGAIGNTMAAMGAGGAGSETFTGYNSGYGDPDALSSSASSGRGYSASFYQEQYTNWERRAQQAYESLTLLGTRVQRGGKDTSGTTGRGMSGSNYTRQKKCLRDAQREMQTIRRKAGKDGVTIRQSHWETVTVSY